MERFSTIQDLYTGNGELSERCLGLNRLRLARGSSWVLWWPCLTFESGSEPAASPLFQGELLSLAKQCDLSVRKVEKWFRHRRNMDRPSLSKKFSEAWWAGPQAMNSGFHGSWAPQTVHCLPLPSTPVQRSQLLVCPPSLHREIPAPSTESILGLPDPLGSTITLCCFSVTETFLAFPLYLQSQISFCCCTFILYWALVSDLSWLCHTGILLWHTFEPEKLSAVYILVLCWCFSSYYKGILSVAFPIVSLSA